MENGPPRYYDADHPREARTHCGHRCVSPHMIPRARETSCCILLTLFASYLSTNQSHVCFHDRAIFCSTKCASGNPTLGAMPSPMADHICVESSTSNFPQLYLNYQVNSNFCLFGVNVLGSRCSLFSRFYFPIFPYCASRQKTTKSFSRPSITGWCLVFSEFIFNPSRDF